MLILTQSEWRHNMISLPLDLSRCSGRYHLGNPDSEASWCPERKTCARHMAAGTEKIQNYKGVPFQVARQDCDTKIDGRLQMVDKKTHASRLAYNHEPVPRKRGPRKD